jgi:hypothetical protein
MLYQSGYASFHREPLYRRRRTRQPHPDAATRRGRGGPQPGGFVAGRLVWDKDYGYPAISDPTGRFQIGDDVGASADVTATKQGYQPYEHWYESNSNLTIALNRISPVSHPLPLFTTRKQRATPISSAALAGRL